MELFGLTIGRPSRKRTTEQHVSPAGTSHKDRAVYESLEQIAGLKDGVKRVFRAVDIGSAINTVCPIELVSGEIVVFVTEDYWGSDQHEEVEEKVLAKGRKLASPNCAIVSAAIIKGLVSGAITSITLKTSARQTQLDGVSDSPYKRMFHELVTWGVENNASDLHINIRHGQAESEVRYTINGLYVAPSNYRRLPTSQLREMINVAFQDIEGGNGTVLDERIEQQGRIPLQIQGQPILLRWASMATDSGPSVTLRILKLHSRILASLDSLGYLPGEIAMLERAQITTGGAIVLAGVVGSGKSTTIATLMSMLPDTRKAITVEDPVEYIIPNALQNSIVRSLDGSGKNDFDSKLKTVKRSAMQDLLIGEIRDQETGRAFMDMTGSGTSVYTTTHAGSALLIGDRLASDFIGISREYLATPGVLKLLVYQALLPKLCAHCSMTLPTLFKSGGNTASGRFAEGQYWTSYATRLESLYGLDAAQLRIRNAEGCSHCRNELLPTINGFAGRTVASEMIEPGLDDDFLRYIKTSDGIALRDHFQAQRVSDYTEPDMRGKTAMECAVYKAARGWIDPRDIELHFRSFETAELAMRPKKASLRVVKSRRTNGVENA